MQEIQAELLTRGSLPVLAGRQENISASRDAVAAELTGRDIWVSHAGPGADEPVDQRPRYLKGQCPDGIPVGEPFSLLVSIVLSGPASAQLKPFDVPSEGRDVLLVLRTLQGCSSLGHQRMTVHVPPQGDSEPVMFEMRC